MRFLLLFAALLATGSPEALGQDFRGAAMLAAQSPRFPCQQAIRLINQAQRPGMSVLWSTFGSSLNCLYAFTSANAHRPHLLHVHFSNEACRRNKRCLGQEVFPTLDVRSYNTLLRDYPAIAYATIGPRVEQIKQALESISNKNTVLMLSTGLEDNYTERAYESIYKMIRSVWPHLMNRNPVSPKAGAGSAIFLESHLLNKKFENRFCLVSEDGNQQQNKDSVKLFKKYKKCFAVFLWRWRWQNNASSKVKRAGVFIPPMERRFRITARDVRDVGATLRTPRG